MRRPLMVAVLLVVLCSSNAEAILVDFTQVTRAPSDALVIDGVTITGSPGFNGIGASSISTVEGIGLGVGGLAPSGSLDRLIELNVTEDFPGTGRDVRDVPLTLTVDGEITALTILPYFTFLGPNAPEPMDRFLMAYNTFTVGATSVPQIQYVDVGSPTTFHFPIRFDPESPLPGAKSILDLGAYDDWDATRIGLYYYAKEHGLTSVTAQFGFSITSLEYTPRLVPEPATVGFLLVGMSAILLRRNCSRGGAL